MTTYKVQSGDTLGAIAARFHTSVAALAKANHLANPDLIHVGQRVVIDAFEAPKAAPKTSTRSAQASGSAPSTGTATKKAQHADTGALPVGMPNTVNMSQAKEFDLYSRYVAKYGDAKAKQDLAAGHRVIVGLRVNTPFTSDRPYRGTYDDRIVVMWKDKSGPHVEEFKANTEPNRRWADDPSQATKPVGRLVGNKTYHYKKSFKSDFGGNILSPDLRYGNPTERRDTNRDHKIGKGDQVYSGDWGGQAIYFHRGATNDTYSAGCQTMDQARFNSFWASLGGQSEFSYVLASVR